MKIKTDPNKMKAFSESVSGFSKKINTECNEIRESGVRCSKRTGEGLETDINALTDNIRRILEESEGELALLAQRIEKHALIVEVLKNAKKDSN